MMNDFYTVNEAAGLWNLSPCWGANYVISRNGAGYCSIWQGVGNT